MCFNLNTTKAWILVPLQSADTLITAARTIIYSFKFIEKFANKTKQAAVRWGSIDRVYKLSIEGAQVQSEHRENYNNNHK